MDQLIYPAGLLVMLCALNEAIIAVKPQAGSASTTLWTNRFACVLIMMFFGHVLGFLPQAGSASTTSLTS